MKTMTKLAIPALLVSIALVLWMTSTDSVLAQGQSGTGLSGSKTAVAHLERTFHWTIAKSATPGTLNMFRGDSGSVQYTVTVAKDNGTDKYFVNGQICVSNTGSVATENLAITDEVMYQPGGGYQTLATASVDLSAMPVLAAGQTYCYPYKIYVTPVAGASAYKNVAHITITNHSGHLGTPWGPNPASSDFQFPTTPDVLINDSIQVTDQGGRSWTFSASGSQSYNKTFTCDTDKGIKSNTATITQTGQTSSASVTVNCYALQVTKDASTSFKRTFSWDIAKSANPSALTLATNQSSPVSYSVVVSTTGYTDSLWAVNGNITVTNPAPISATINGVSDVVSTGLAATPSCPVTFPYALAAGATLACTYSRSLADASTRTNTATATLQNTPSGTADFTGSATVDFGQATINAVDRCIDVSDTFNGSLGTVCQGVDALPKTFTYNRTIGPYTTCGDRNVDNTASFVTNNTGATDSANARVSVHVPCAGCTLTIGYWKTHAGFDPQPDMVTPHLPQWLGTSGGPKSQNVTTAALAVQFLNLNGSNNSFDASNGINRLYAQLLAAKLNIANGADGSAVASTISAADAFLATHDSLDWISLSEAEKNQVSAWATMLDNYNNGLIGPGHCS